MTNTTEKNDIEVNKEATMESVSIEAGCPLGECQRDVAKIRLLVPYADDATRILFVCTGNTCRSPLAEAILSHLIEKDGRSTEFEVLSAGLMAQTGECVSNLAWQAASAMGLDLSWHRARQLNQYMMEEAHIIFTMTRAHKEMLVFHYPEYAGKIWTLTEYTQAIQNGTLMKLLGKEETEIQETETFMGETGQNITEKIPAPDIQDPYGFDIQVYQQCAYQLQEHLTIVWDFLKSARKA